MTVRRDVITMYWVTYGKFRSYIDNQGFIAWFRNEGNMAKYKAALTDGMKLVEIYFPILNTAEHEVEIWFKIDNWAVLDKDRENEKIRAVLTEMIRELGVDMFEWIRTKALRTLHDVQSAFNS